MRRTTGRVDVNYQELHRESNRCHVNKSIAKTRDVVTMNESMVCVGLTHKQSLYQKILVLQQLSSQAMHSFFRDRRVGQVLGDSN